MTSSEQLIHDLEVLNFSRLEAQIYVTLITHDKLNGSQMAKLLNLSRSSVYAALNSLYHKGCVVMVPGESNLYKAEDPDALIDKLTQEFLHSAESLKDELSKYRSAEAEHEYYNLRGRQNFILKTKELLMQAQREVYLNSTFDLRLFADETRALAQRGVRIIVFSFEDIHAEDLPVEFFRKRVPDSGCEHERMMLVVDLKNALIAGSYHGGEVMGTFTENPLLVDIISEHIHLDIYLLKLQHASRSRNLLDNMRLNTLVEKNF
jgi:HTH-type transcriptional regulator, sugar sensing transcriptional regulator